MTQGKVFAIGDVHGCNSELKQLLTHLPLDSDSTIVFLGDYVDRGPDSKGVIETILELNKRFHVVALMGNHESMMLEFLRDPSAPLAGFFVLNGGSATLASYVTEGNRYEIPDHHLEFLQSLKLFYETSTHFFVHAGVPNVKLSHLNAEEYRNEIMWVRQSFLNSQFKWEKIIVHGHTPSAEAEVTKTRINLDTGCVFNGHLTAMEMNSQTIYQVKAKEIPKTFLKENPQISRVAKRFLGTIPVFIENQQGTYDQFLTINYNEFGLLIVDMTPSERIFEVGQVLKGVIGATNGEQIDFVGQVVRHQSRGSEIAYGIKMLEPLEPSYKAST